MKKNIFLVILVTLVICALIVSRFWVFGSVDINDPPTVQNPVTDQGSSSEPEAGDVHEPEPDTGEEDRLLAEQREAEIIAKREHVLEESLLLSRGYFYDEAIALLNDDEDIINHETQALEAEILEAKNSLVRFDGEIKHIFFHSLILYPEVLFPNLSVPTGGYNEGFIYQSEFNRLLPQLLERGYVLYNISDIFSKDAGGVMRQNDIYLPPGKMPLVLSIDDPSYHYGYKLVRRDSNDRIVSFDRDGGHQAGFANRIIRDEHGEIATEVITPSGETIITYDGDVHVVLDAFVRENPEFSYRGHKGVIASTGYMGIFGYDLPDLRDPDTRQEVIAICDKFKENGWLFASHSYSHNRVGFWGPESNPANIRRDIGRWKEEIEPLVGQTNLFIAPYGFLLRGEGMQVILDNGFDIYCTVDFNQPINLYDTHAVMGRIEIGGYSLVRWANTLNRDFFDVDYVKDSHRPPILSG